MLRLCLLREPIQIAAIRNTVVICYLVVWTMIHCCMHIAARNGNITLVKLLIIFDADPNLKNQDGETPLDVAVPDCKKIIEKILTLRKHLTETRARKLAKPLPKRDDDEVFLLSLDGGGIRGLVFIQAIIELDKRREQVYPGSNFSFLFQLDRWKQHRRTLSTRFCYRF